MSISVAQEWRNALEIEHELGSLIKDKAPRFDDVEALIEKLRFSCERTIFLDFEFAQEEGVERHLWDAHIKINGRYRKVVDHYRQGDKKKNVVERRKVEQRYVDFIKRSQFFYKGYIQRLASHFSGLKELRRIAHRLSLSALGADDRVKVPPEVEQLIDMSCHSTLLRLGDLSRYRNNLRTKNRSWEPALGYYSLANDLAPDNGSAHNQMAVIALADGDHLHAVYHLYRAIAVNEPHPLAQGNLEIEFKKIVAGWEKQRSQPKSDSLTTLIWWFVLLHAKYYDGEEFATRGELENEVLSRLALLLKEQTFGDVLEKFILINIAAEQFAGTKVEALRGNSTPGGTKAIETFFFCLGFNVRMMIMLLQVLQPELEEGSQGDDLPTNKFTPTPHRERVTPAMRQILSAVRQYSVWLVSQISVIVTPLKKRGTTDIHIKELWKTYADVLTQLINVFPPSELKSVGYLLEEDANTVGFKPFCNPQYPQDCNPYYDHVNHQLKPRVTDRGIERHLPAMEMQSRIRDIVLCGLVLQSQDQYPHVPMTVIDGVFVYIEEGLPIVKATGSPHLVPSASPRNTTIQSSNPPEVFANVSADSLAVPAGSIAASDTHGSIDLEMSRFVDKLTDPSNKPTSSNETSYGMHSNTANEVFRTPSGTQQHTRVRSIPKAFPSLPIPGFGSNPWTPKPDELNYSPSGRNTNTAPFSAFGTATSSQQVEGYMHVGQGNGYEGIKQRVWNGSPSSPHSPNSNQYSHEQVTHSTISSTMDWENNTSIYTNTPELGRPRRSGVDSRTAAGLNTANNSTYYPGAIGYETEMEMMLNSPIAPIGSQRHKGTPSYTPPAGQGDRG